MTGQRFGRGTRLVLPLLLLSSGVDAASYGWFYGTESYQTCAWVCSRSGQGSCKASGFSQITTAAKLQTILTAMSVQCTSYSQCTGWCNADDTPSRHTDGTCSWSALGNCAGYWTGYTRICPCQCEPGTYGSSPAGAGCIKYETHLLSASPRISPEKQPALCTFSSRLLFFSFQM